MAQHRRDVLLIPRFQSVVQRQYERAAEGVGATGELSAPATMLALLKSRLTMQRERPELHFNTLVANALQVRAWFKSWRGHGKAGK